MRWNEFVGIVSGLPTFDLQTVVQMAEQSRSTIRVKLHRWTKAGRIVRLRRGLYTLSGPYHKTQLSAAYVANQVYQPSYLSVQWALSHYGLIPDSVPLYQSVSPRVTREFGNSFGSFTYASLKQHNFWGYVTQLVGEETILIANPEKALLDFWYLNSGEWTTDRLIEMRFQQPGLVDVTRLNAYVDRWDSPKLKRAAGRFASLLQIEEEFENIQ